jgi:hypothetical protein
VRYAVVALALLALSGCGGRSRPTIVRVTVAPGPEGPQSIVAAAKLGPGVRVRLDAIRDALPARLPANPRQRCVFGPVVTVTLTTGVVSYGPCVRPASIERLRHALLAVAHQRPTLGPAAPAEWKAVLEDWYDGRIDDWHRCAAVRAAIRHLPIDLTYSSGRSDLSAYAGGVC